MKGKSTLFLMGIVCMIYGLQGILFPLLKSVFSHEILFEFFHCSSWTALVVYICFAVAGTAVVLLTKSFSKRNKPQK